MRRLLTRPLIVLCAVLAVAASLLSPLTVAAEPGDDSGEGGNATLLAKLEAAGKAYNTAEKTLKASQAQQAANQKQIKTLQGQLDVLTTQLDAIAANLYVNGRTGTLTAVMNSGSPEAYLSQASILDRLGYQNDSAIRNYLTTKAALSRQQAALNQAIATGKAQLAIMAKRKKDALDALVAAGGGVPDGFSVSGLPRAARSGPRGDGCTQTDPTNPSGCLTPTMLHAYQEARSAGFTHYTHCFRQASFGEHPKGRACDFAAAKDGFGGEATGADKTYGNQLAGWAIQNASTLDVLYVIWFKRIWMPSTGWRSYSGDGTPSGDHRNHVHISVN
ncbi:coiled-coil domain-containing protein [Fodinicola acaciae]|uniref:coiled-coil domain-containing protein n=1 Tax=Fodinicola acaciae TaxID=2681555 RepID=UPI0013D88479|nr:hypothetical protein [Fodinicola acaciae]